MSYHKVLAGLGDVETAPRVMAAAAALAREHDAQLLAVHVVPVGITEESGSPVSQLAERLKGIYEKEQERSAFSGEWRIIGDSALSVSAALVELGNTCDAVVLAQRHDDEAGRGHWYLGEHVIGVCARPVILVPETDGVEFSADQVLLAWDGSALASRAAFDALPVLQRASSVHVHRFNPPGKEREHRAGLAEAFAETLARHGVAIELSHSDVSRFEIGEEILAIAQECSSELLVSGCRLHSRIRQFVFGDTTRHLLANSTLPLLMGG